jgi:uncharacterized SAM-binding protein YcdF (DUF218 family)
MVLDFFHYHMRRIISVKNIIGFLTLCFLGLQIFLAEEFLKPLIPDDLSEKTDAIVVFTGSANRVKTGAELFKNKMAKFLYISGVNQKTTKNMILEKIGFSNLNIDHIFIDFAKNTEENVLHVAKWIKENNIKSIRLVTNCYHINRAQLLIANKLPELKIISYCVQENNKHKNRTKFMTTLEEILPELWYARYEFLKFQYTYWVH